MKTDPNLIQYTKKILQRMNDTIDEKNTHLMAPEEKKQEILDVISSEISQCPQASQQRLNHEFFNSGPLEALIHDPRVTEILITPDHIHFEKQGVIQLHSDQFLSDFTFNRFINRISDESQVNPTLQRPFADGSWNQFRVHAVRQPITTQNIALTLRRHSRSHWNFNNLVDCNLLNDETAQLLQMNFSAKKNMLVVGPTGSGKTTIINALLQTTDENERIVIIEDTDELIQPNPVSVKLLTRQPNCESLPEINQQTLLHQALRMRPDRILVGEVRGPEAKDLLLTLSTGHSGFVGSLHAKSAREALWRLEMLIQMGAPQWTTDTIRKLIQFSLDSIVVLEKEKNKRRITEIMRLVSLENHGFLMEPLYQTETSR